jgi:hypothetical protein
VAASPDYSKAGRSRRIEENEVKGSNVKETAPKSWYHAGVENGMRRSKPRWMLMIGRHPLMATDVRERAEAKEGLYLGCRLRYSRRKRGQDDCHGREVIERKNEVIGG